MKRLNKTYRGEQTKRIKKQHNILKVVLVLIILITPLINLRISKLIETKTELIKISNELTEEKQEPLKIEDLHIINIEQRWIEPIENAAKEFGVDPLLIYGIANAESGLGKYFYNEYDRENCFNLWGLKGGNTAKRIAKEGSYLRCFNDEVAGARTIAKTLRLYYLDEGRDTPEKICQKWVGAKFAKTHCSIWVENVNEILASN